MPECPHVSVIIACRNARVTIDRCLSALRSQVTSTSFEVIVADSSNDGTDRIITERYPEVRLLHFSERKWPGDARNAGIAVSRGEMIGFIDADCIAEPHWLETMASALRGWAGTVGGEIAQAEPAGASAWAAYFCEFSHWMPGTPPGRVFEVPTCNMGVSRASLQAAGPFQEGVYCSDSEFHWRLRAMGRETHFIPAMRVAHITEGGWNMLANHEFFHGRSFGRMRVRRGGVTGSRLWFARLSGAFPPAWLAVKTTGRVLSRGRYLGEFTLCLPLFLVAIASWGVGELAGYWSREQE